MKKTVLLFLLFVIIKSQGQNYQISFAGSGASSNVVSVKVENLTQCKNLTLSGSDILHLLSNVGIDNKNDLKDNSIHIYPNPMTDYCLINFEAAFQGESTINLFDITGKRILQKKKFLTKGNQTFRLNGINSGIYILKIESNHYSYTGKITSSIQSNGIAEIEHINTAQIINEEIDAYNSDNEMSMNQKGAKSIRDMKYNTGDILKLTGISDIYRTVVMLVPTESQTVTFDFIECKDADNNNYAVVKIGNQVWMEENLKTTKFNNGNPIPLVTDTLAWINSTGSPAYCWVNNNIALKNTYGALYNWYTLITSPLCPTGWHVLTDTDWNTLVNYLGGTNIAGGAMKEACSSTWKSPNTGATNSSGFTGLATGNRRFSDGKFYSMGDIAIFWSSSSAGGSNVYDYGLSVNNTTAITYTTGSKTNGFSVRCVK